MLRNGTDIGARRLPLRRRSSLKEFSTRPCRGVDAAPPARPRFPCAARDPSSPPTLDYPAASPNIYTASSDASSPSDQLRCLNRDSYSGGTTGRVPDGDATGLPPRAVSPDTPAACRGLKERLRATVGWLLDPPASAERITRLSSYLCQLDDLPLRGTRPPRELRG